MGSQYGLLWGPHMVYHGDPLFISYLSDHADVVVWGSLQRLEIGILPVSANEFCVCWVGP